MVLYRTISVKVLYRTFWGRIGTGLIHPALSVLPACYNDFARAWSWDQAIKRDKGYPLTDDDREQNIPHC